MSYWCHFHSLINLTPRPAVIVSSNGYNTNRRDLIIMAITSQLRTPLGFGEAIVTDWQSAGLIKLSVLKPVFAAIEQSLVVRTLGALSVADTLILREVAAQSAG